MPSRTQTFGSSSGDTRRAFAPATAVRRGPHGRLDRRSDERHGAPTMAASGHAMDHGPALDQPALRALACGRGDDARSRSLLTPIGHVRGDGLGIGRSILSQPLATALATGAAVGLGISGAECPHVRNVRRKARRVLLQSRCGKPARRRRRPRPVQAAILQRSDDGAGRRRWGNPVRYPTRRSPRERRPIRRALLAHWTGSAKRAGHAGPLADRAILPVLR